VDEGLVLHDGQGRGQADAVVGAEGRSLGIDPIALDLGLDGVLAEVVDLVGVLFADHVEMALEDGPHGTLPSGRGGFADEDVADLVALAGEAQRSGHAEDVIAQGLFVAGTVRDGQDLGEMLPEKPGFELNDR